MRKLYTSIAMLFAGTMAFGQLSLTHVSTYETGIFDESAAEIVTYDKGSQKLFFGNSDDNSVGVLDFSDPTNPTALTTIDIDPYGDGVNSVNAYDGVVAVAVEIDESPGKVVFFEEDGTFLSQVVVGHLPDMLTFTPDGQKVIVGCEGEPSDDWSYDPEGTIGIINVSGGFSSLSQANVTLLDFNSVNLGNDVRIFGPDGIGVFTSDFQNEDTTNFDSVFVDWQQFNIQGSSRNWGEYEFPSGSAQLYAHISGFDGGCQDQEDYLVSNDIDLSDFVDANLSFSSAYNFSGPALELLISTDFNGSDVQSATWDTLSGSVNWPSTDGYNWENSGDISLAAYAGQQVNIAFLYESNTSGCSTWQIDSVEVSGERNAASNLEPEYITVTDDGNTAYVALQENNALAIVNLTTNTITGVKGLGYKDHSLAGNGLDASNRDDSINITTYPFKGMYMPDAITSYTINGSTYIISANEGDARDYDAYSEEERLKDVTLDPVAFPNAATLQLNENGGRIKITTSQGDTDGDGDYDEIYTYGARSFSIWDDAGNLVYDSGDEFEQKLAELYPDDFNSNNDENQSFDSRSDDKGSEPEAVEVAMINGEYYAFVGLERMGGVMFYNVNDPTAPSFIQYLNNRDFSVVDVTTSAVGDLGVEDILFISGYDSPDSLTYIVTSNEVSGTISVFNVEGAEGPVDTTTVGLNQIMASNSWSVYPNPTGSELNVSSVGTYQVLDATGRVVLVAESTRKVNVAELREGVYMIRNENGDVRRFVKQ